MTRYLVTGGAGFIGANFVRYLLRTYPDCQVVNLDKLTYCGNLDNLKDLANDPRYRFVHGDIADPAVVATIFAEGIDVVVNFAAETHVDRSIGNPADFITTNVYGAYVLLEAAKVKPVKQKICKCKHRPHKLKAEVEFKLLGKKFCPFCGGNVLRGNICNQKKAGKI